MKAYKRVLSDLPFCYCVAPLVYNKELHFLAASEKEYSCLLFDRYGNRVDEIWKGPGGTMSAVQLPGVDGAFLATHKFYSPNMCKEAKIVLCRRGDGGWVIRTIAELPYVHRFDILCRDGANYLLACCIKSDYEYKDDWRFPGMTLAYALPDRFEDLQACGPLKPTVLKDGMFHNHGYCRSVKNGLMSGIVTSDEGVFRFTPPAQKGGAWAIDQLIGDPASDAVLIDFDGDGEDELLTLSPFHGDTLRVYRKEGAAYVQVFAYDKRIAFAHAITAGTICGEKMAIVGHRKGDRDLLAVRYNESGYYVEVLDHDIGPANVLHAVVDGKDILLSANREVNEVAYYELTVD